MKKAGLILLAGLLLFSLTHGSNRATGQHTCPLTHCEIGTSCHLISHAHANTYPVALTTLQEPAGEQQVAFTSRMLQLLDTFAKLVMVI